MFKPLITPRVNLNGDTRETLVGQQRDVMNAIRTLQTAMGAAVPHGRNYQTLPGAENIAANARAAWDERRAALNNLYDEVQRHAIEISQQEDWRKIATENLG